MPFTRKHPAPGTHGPQIFVHTAAPFGRTKTERNYRKPTGAFRKANTTGYTTSNNYPLLVSVPPVSSTSKGGFSPCSPPHRRTARGSDPGLSAAFDLTFARRPLRCQVGSEGMVLSTGPTKGMDFFQVATRMRTTTAIMSWGVLKPVDASSPPPRSIPITQHPLCSPAAIYVA